MAILSTAKVVGMLVSAKKTGKQILNAAGEYVAEVVEDFVSGFMGHGWKIWEYVKGKWMLEIDSIRVREQFIVFEMLVSKMRAIIGSLGISQACGKIATVTLSEDGTEYLITLEDETMSFVAHDFMRCQTYTGTKQTFYHVEISSVVDDVVHVPVSEFDRDAEGIVTNPPEPGNDIVQFGNSVNKNRQSAIYIHADESGQPAIDIMFDIDSKDWTGKVKTRLGGDIPGGDGARGFYCENGMIKGTDSSGHTVYCIHPDGSAEFGDGSAKFNADKSGSLAGGAISWAWDASKNQFITSFKNVVIKWENLDDEVKENLKGEKGDKGDKGDTGEKGGDGTNGADGINGKDGTSIVWKGSYVSHPSNPQNGWAYKNTTDGKSYVYQDGTWYQMTIDGVDGANGKDGADGLDIVWKGDLSTPPTNPVKNWVYRDTDNGRVYIYNGTAWTLMVADGNDGTNGAAGSDGLSVYITYHDSESQPAVPTGNGTSDGWHTNATNAVVWMSQKVAESASSGSWGTPIRAKGTDGEDAVLYIFEFEQDGKVINSIPAFADETPKFQSDIIFKLYKIAGSDKQLCADYYLYVQIFNSDGSNYINEHNNLSSQYQFSSAYGVSYTVFATTGTHQTGDRIIEASISKVMDGQQGLPGSDANVPDWVKEWDTGKTQIGSEYMISPKLFTGKNTGTAEEPVLTGIVQGDKCITINGVERSGIFALADNEIIFALDAKDGSGSLAKGTTYWDKFGQTYRKTREIIVWRRLSEEINAIIDKIENPEDYPDEYDLNLEYGTYLQTVGVDIYVNLPDPAECPGLIIDVYDMPRTRVLLNWAKFRCKISPILKANAAGVYEPVVVDDPGRMEFGSSVIRSEMYNDVYRWIADSDFVVVTV
jgi:hypothetical protein|nr:MAG TPA: tail protein [Caudoviricetes sp.]